MKNLLILVLAVVLIVALSQLETYFTQPNRILPIIDKSKVSYYLADFSLQQFDAQGQASYAVTAKHLSHWQGEKRSEIIQPLITGHGKTAEEQIITRADLAQFDHSQQQADLSGHISVEQSHTNTAQGFKLQTEQLRYNLTTREISTNSKIELTSPAGHLQATGLLGKLNEDYLRLNANVRATYQLP
jgi:LPS export ABC transporter protein LptC